MITPDGKPGWRGSWYKHLDDNSMTPQDQPFKQNLIDETRIFISTSTPEGITKRWSLKLEGQLKPKPYDRKFEFGMVAAGRSKVCIYHFIIGTQITNQNCQLFVDGQLVIDNWTRQRRGNEFFTCGSMEETGIFNLKANTKHNILVEYCNVRAPADGDENEALMDSNPGVRLGGAEVIDEDQEMEKAIKLASEADVVVAIVGLNADWESEGHDRTTLALPRRTDELIEKVAKANPKTVVVTQSVRFDGQTRPQLTNYLIQGSSITLPWVDSVAAIVHSWYLGNATGEAIADVLLGNTNPSGRLSLTFPKRMEDLPSYGHFHSENGKVGILLWSAIPVPPLIFVRQVRYAEDIYMVSYRRS